MTNRTTEGSIKENYVKRFKFSIATLTGGKEVKRRKKIYIYMF